MISMSWPHSIMPAVTTAGPLTLRYMRLGVSLCRRNASAFRLRTMSVTSSRTPAMVENSCSTPSIWAAVIAAPCSDESRMRRSALPSVTPKPRSSGSAIKVASRSGRAPGTVSSLGGLISSCQFLWITGYLETAWLANGGRDGRGSGTPRRSASIAMRAGPTLHPTPLARPAAVVRDRGDVADRGDGEAHALQRAQRRLAPGAGPAHLDLERLHAVLHRLAPGVLGGDLRGERGRLA